VDRREFLKSAAAGALTMWPSRRLTAQQPNTVTILDGGGSNVLAFSGREGLVLVDSGAPKSGDAVMAKLKTVAAGAKVQTLFNTHYHTDQTGNNEVFAAAGANIIAHKRTLEWMSSDYWVPAEERYEKARPKAARPTETFLTTGSCAIRRSIISTERGSVGAWTRWISCSPSRMNRPGSCLRMVRS
jgi:glyoxylase-like metal-dependent hydrolase (beta-lactamase superfamily II)